MRRVRGLLTVAAAFATLGTLPAPAAAEGRGGGAYISDSGSPTAEAREAVTAPARPRPRPKTGTVSNCRSRVQIEDDTAFAVYDEDGNRLYSETGRWLARECDGQDVQVGGFYVPPERRRVPVDPATLAREARQSVDIPAPPIATSPSADRKLYVQLRTWLWVDPAWWQGYTATADAGGVASTVSARPVRAVWSTGDGGRTVCNGPGVAWRPGMADDATYCSYVYKHSSSAEPAGTYTLTVTVDFEVSWASTLGAGGALPTVTRSASTAVEVGEIQAIETQ